jgi:predicted  nucleic acid-binding Zn-ribbon protein
MATVDPKQTLIGLIRLQQLDADVWRMKRRIAEGPQLLARRNERATQAEARVQQTQAKILDFKKQIGALELDVKTKDVEILKIQGAQGQSRTNEEFRAFGEHVSRLKKEKNAIEDRILEFLQQIESADATLKEQKATLDSLKKESAENAAVWQREEAEYKAELASADAKRAEYARSLPPGPLSTYERVLKARDGKAVVPVELKNCGGCQMAITPNDLNRLHSSSELVYCRSCERILYFKEVAQQKAT